MRKILIRRYSIKKNDLFVNDGKQEGKFKGVVYSCVNHSYDALHNPLFYCDEIDYKLFIDDTIKVSNSFWNVEQIEIEEKFINYANRFYKMHPFELFDKYDYAVYVDGNVQVISDLSPLYYVARKSKTGLAFHLHSMRDCAYDEAQVCKILKKGNKNAINNQMMEYKKNGFPKNYGLLECPIIVVDLQNENGKIILDAWWDEFVKWGSMRDQLSLPYVLWKKGYSINDVGLLGTNAKENYKFRFYSHI